MLRPALAFALLGSLLATAACASSSGSGDDGAGETSDDALTKKADAEWFYDGPLPMLTNPNVTVSLVGHTARVTGFAPASLDVSQSPHVKAFATAAPGGAALPAGMQRLEIVYPIATARAGKSNSQPGTYAFQLAKPYRPDGAAVTPEEGQHFVTWGGYPFIVYNDGIAFHGPITSDANPNVPDGQVWYLQRGPVSGGCNRMNGEHVVELTHLIGISMRKVYDANRGYAPKTAAKVTVLADYDQLDGKYVDVDYPSFTGMTRPGTVYGTDQVTMFGSWMATETPDGSDLPASQKWEGGVPGKLYVFKEHARANVVCSVEKTDLAALKAYAAKSRTGELPAGFCAKKSCIVSALEASKDPAATCP